MERTFVMIKPDHVHRAEEIYQELDRFGTMVLRGRVDSVPRSIMEQHYSVHAGTWHFKPVVDYFVGKEIDLAVYCGIDVVRAAREILGATDPADAEPHTIRARYTNDSFKRASREGRPIVRNVMHASHSAEEAEREIEVWRSFLYPVSRPVPRTRP